MVFSHSNDTVISIAEEFMKRLVLFSGFDSILGNK